MQLLKLNVDTLASLGYSSPNGAFVYCSLEIQWREQHRQYLIDVFNNFENNNVSIIYCNKNNNITTIINDFVIRDVDIFNKLEENRTIYFFVPYQASFYQESNCDIYLRIN